MTHLLRIETQIPRNPAVKHCGLLEAQAGGLHQSPFVLEERIAISGHKPFTQNLEKGKEKEKNEV